MALLLALYSASRGVDTLRKALNLAHDVAETRPLWKTEALAFGMTGGGGLLLVGAVAGLAAGGNAGLWLAGHVGVATTYVIVWGWLRWPVTAGVSTVQAHHDRNPQLVRHYLGFR
jgi:membrane protein